MNEHTFTLIITWFLILVIAVGIIGSLCSFIGGKIIAKRTKRYVERAKDLEYTELERDIIIKMLVERDFINNAEYESRFDGYNREHSITYPSPEAREIALETQRETDINKFINKALHRWHNHDFGEAVAKLLDRKTLEHFVKLKESSPKIEIVLG